MRSGELNPFQVEVHYLLNGDFNRKAAGFIVFFPYKALFHQGVQGRLFFLMVGWTSWAWDLPFFLQPDSYLVGGFSPPI